MKKIKATDAQERAKNHPDTFEAPSQEELDQLKVGEGVRIQVSKERFWCIIKKINGNKIEARIDNDLDHTKMHGLKLNDLVTFEKRHIYTIFSEHGSGTKRWVELPGIHLKANELQGIAPDILSTITFAVNSEIDKIKDGLTDDVKIQFNVGFGELSISVPLYINFSKNK